MTFARTFLNNLSKTKFNYQFGDVIYENPNYLKIAPKCNTFGWHAGPLDMWKSQIAKGVVNVKDGAMFYIANIFCPEKAHEYAVGKCAKIGKEAVMLKIGTPQPGTENPDDNNEIMLFGENSKDFKTDFHILEARKVKFDQPVKINILSRCWMAFKETLGSGD